MEEETLTAEEMAEVRALYQQHSSTSSPKPPRGETPLANTKPALFARRPPYIPPPAEPQPQATSWWTYAAAAAAAAVVGYIAWRWLRTEAPDAVKAVPELTEDMRKKFYEEILEHSKRTAASIGKKNG